VRYRMLLLVPVLAAGVCHAQSETAVYPCHRPSTAPVIDGDVANDAAWASIPTVTGFRVLGADYAFSKQTTARMCWDEEAFYVGVEAEEPDAAQLKPTARDGGWTWGEDSVEVFLQPVGQVYQIGVTAGGAKGSGAGNPDVSLCQAAAQIGNDNYSLELRVPYAVLGTKAPTSGDNWRGSVCRNIFITTSGGDQFTTWAPLQNAFLEPRNYCDIRFDDSTPTTEQALGISQQLSSEYRGQLQTRLQAAVDRMSQYVADLREAAKDRRFARPAHGLLRQWRHLERTARRGEQASTQEMRKGLVGVEAMVQRAYEIKYEYLLARLIEE